MRLAVGGGGISGGVFGRLMGRERIEGMFERVRARNRPGLIVFLTAGFPDLETTEQLIPALIAAGADAVEVGIPFSDPLAEGPVIQESSFRALQAGVTLQDCLNLVARLRHRTPDAPLLLMGYYNPIYAYGVARFVDECDRVGVDGLIAVDLPGFEAGQLSELCAARGVSVIPLLAPTSADASIAAACAGASGFVYCISVTGVTGARSEVSQRGVELVRRVRAHTALPLAVGFGISRPEHIAEVGQTAEAAVVGSALVRVMLEAPPGEVVSRAAQFVAGLAGAAAPGG